MIFRTRFAPSPTGFLHIGHAYSALRGHEMAREESGVFLLRIEDLDTSRCRPEYEDAIYEDLHWLGIHWDEPVVKQSANLARYDAAMEQLSSKGLLYPCSCNRRAIKEALSAPQEGNDPIQGPDGLIYPGICRGRTMYDQQPSDALRINMEKAMQHVGDTCTFLEIGDHETGQISAPADTLIHQVGDVVLGRRETGQIAYHLAAVVDDAEQQISHIIRGHDLFDATQIHVVLQTLLDLPTPTYLHHRLIRDDTGKRLAKRDDARAIRKYRQDGFSPSDVRQMVGLSP